MPATPDAGLPLLRIPPFPGAKVRSFQRLPARSHFDQAAVVRCANRIRELRIGGTYWAAQPALPSRYLLVRSREALPFCNSLIEEHDAAVLWSPASEPGLDGVLTVTGVCDPWHLLAGAGAVVMEAGDEVGALAALAGVPGFVRDPRTASLVPHAPDLASLLPTSDRFADPFTGEPIGLGEAIELCGFWRRLIDSNRGLAGGLGFAFWKQKTVAPLLWSGNGDFPFLRGVPAELDQPTVAVWRSKASGKSIDELERRGATLVEVEDGFLRSSGLGADCVPPLSITVDRLGAHFDPARPSELELLLQDGSFEDALLARARSLRETIVAAGLGKYERGRSDLPRPGGARRHVLVPGQVEDDRSILTGGCGLASNLELLERVRRQEPDSFILYKPHPDVLSGHRVGDIPEKDCLRFADAVVSDAPISALLDMVDAVHVNTSLAGFEALMRGKDVTTHGVPFYAGWGLTTDLGPVPARRSSHRSLDELVAATLLLYPRYLDPVSGLPCPAETVVRRLCADGKATPGVLPALRRFQGRLKRSLRILVR